MVLWSTLRAINLKLMYMWQKWTTALLGLLVLAVPFLRLSGDALTWTLVVTGVAVAALSVWAATKDVSATDEFMGTTHVNRLQQGHQR